MAEANYSITLGRNLQKVLATNSTSTAFTAKVATLTEPVNDGVVNLSAGGIEVPQYLKITPYGTGSANDGFSIRVIGWKRGGSGVQTTWFPTTLCEMACLLGAATGAAGGYLVATDLLCDTITVVTEPTITAATTRQGTVILFNPADDTEAWFAVPLVGSQKVEFTFDQTTNTPGMNALISPY